MKTSRNVFSPSSGQPIPVTTDLKVKPLKYEAEIVKNGHGRIKMDDEWIYINMPGYGNCAINVPRSQFCQKVYLSETNILDSIGSAKVTNRLACFISEVSDKLVFEKNGITYRVYLTKTKKGFDLGYVRFYWLNTHSPNIHMTEIPERYKPFAVLPEKALSQWAHELVVDLEKAFNFSES